jgi:uncharacterized protein YjbI with pentapeptide repeats
LRETLQGTDWQGTDWQGTNLRGTNLIAHQRGRHDEIAIEFAFGVGTK